MEKFIKIGKNYFNPRFITKIFHDDMGKIKFYEMTIENGQRLAFPTYRFEEDTPEYKDLQNCLWRHNVW